MAVESEGASQTSEHAHTTEMQPPNDFTNTLTDVTNAQLPELKRDIVEDVHQRPPTAAPSLISQHSVDSAIGDEGQVSDVQQMDTTNAQEIVEGVESHAAAVDPSNVDSLGLTEHQQQDLQAAVDGGQLAEEQELDPDEGDSDSAIGSDTSSITTSLTESIWNYRKEHGRTYHAYKDGKYIFPNDERESDRLDLQHHLFRLTFGQKLHFAPLRAPTRALDVGTGTGIWAIEFADEYPDCQVLGIDLSPGQPTLVPPNCKFMVDDVEDLWVYQEKFDFIHARLMSGTLADWPGFLRQAYENLEPGGWLELQDYGLPVKSADGTADGTDLMRWGELLCEAARKMGRPMGTDCAVHYYDWMKEAGFVDVHQRHFMWPTNMWPKDPLMKLLGQWNLTNILEGLEGFCLALLTRGLGWRKEEVDVFVARVSNDLRNRKIHAYFPMPVTYGRKPFQGEVAFSGS